MKIAIKRKRLLKQLDAVNWEIKALQVMCPHTNATTKPRSGGGGWSNPTEHYWYDFTCPDCGKFWSEDQ